MRTMTPDRNKVDQRRLQEQTHENMMNFIDSELKLAVTMSKLAQTEADTGDKPHAKELLKKVEQAKDSVRRSMATRFISDHERLEIKERLQDIIEHEHAAKQRILEAPRRTPRQNA